MREIIEQWKNVSFSTDLAGMMPSSYNISAEITEAENDLPEKGIIKFSFKMPASEEVPSSGNASVYVAFKHGDLWDCNITPYTSGMDNETYNDISNNCQKVMDILIDDTTGRKYVKSKEFELKSNKFCIIIVNNATTNFDPEASEDHAVLLYKKHRRML